MGWRQNCTRNYISRLLHCSLTSIIRIKTEKGSAWMGRNVINSRGSWRYVWREVYLPIYRVCSVDVVLSAMMETKLRENIFWFPQRLIKRTVKLHELPPPRMQLLEIWLRLAFIFTLPKSTSALRKINSANIAASLSCSRFNLAIKKRRQSFVFITQAAA